MTRAYSLTFVHMGDLRRQRVCVTLGSHDGLQAMAKNKAQLVTALSSLELRLKDSHFLAGSTVSLVDLVVLADVRAAFEKARPLLCCCGSSDSEPDES